MAQPMLPEPANPADILAELDNVPLFMRNLPEDGTSNPTIEALQSLLHDGTPDENAENFKEKGNEYFKAKRFREALKFYTQGVDAAPDDPSLLQAILLNRAAAHLELQNYGSALKDTARVLQSNSTSSKALFRSAAALRALDRLDEALDACARCLAFDPGNKPVQALADSVKDAKKKKELKEAARKREAEMERQERDMLKIACVARNLIFSTTKSVQANTYGAPHFDPSNPKPYTPTSSIIFPVFLLYPPYNTSDFISHFHEHSTFGDQLDVIFPPDNAPAPWDRNAQYVGGKSMLAVYVTTVEKRLLKIGAKMTLADVFLNVGKEREGAKKKDTLIVKDGYLSFVVLPKGEVEKAWVEEFKRERDGAGK